MSFHAPFLILFSIFFSICQCENADNRCTYGSIEGVYFYGPIVKKLDNVASADQCARECWNYVSKEARCRSANFLRQKNRCELMHQTFNTNDRVLMTYYGFLDQNAVYVVPSNCPAIASTGTDAAGGSDQGAQIPKGSCGQTLKDPMASGLVRIVGGTEAKPNSIPWIVSIRQGYTPPRQHICGGTLIRVNDKIDETDLVITAAHCNEEGAEVDVVVGVHDPQKAPDDQRRDVVAFINHEQYDQTSKDNDIAIIKLAQPVKFGNTVQPACLPASGERLPDGTKGLVSGWGHMKEGQDRATKLQQLQVPIINHQQCFDYYKVADKPRQITEAMMICAGYPEGGKDSCQGDSGGPLVFKSGKGYVLQGVVSFGNGCAVAKQPGIYARVSTYIDWINKKIEEISEVAKRTS